MTAPDEPPLQHQPSGQPIGDLLLAQALERCIQAERAVPGSSAKIIARTLPAARADLERLMALVRALESAAASGTPSAAFRTAARRRLMRRTRGESGMSDQPLRIGSPPLAALSGSGGGARSRVLAWCAAGLAGLVGLAVAATATVSTSASALPGDALYGFKQAQEELALRLAAEEEDRVLAMLRRADARLDETARLLELGRTVEAVESAQRFDAVAERATSTLVVTVDFGQIQPARSEELETMLAHQHQRLYDILQMAPEPARADLRDALAVTDRGRQVVVESRPAARSSPPESVRPAPVGVPPEAADAAPPAEAAPPPEAVDAESTPSTVAASSPSHAEAPTPRPTSALTSTAVKPAVRADADRRDLDRSDEREPPVIAQVGGAGVGSRSADSPVSRPRSTAADNDDRLRHRAGDDAPSGSSAQPADDDEHQREPTATVIGSSGSRGSSGASGADRTRRTPAAGAHIVESDSRRSSASDVSENESDKTADDTQTSDDTKTSDDTVEYTSLVEIRESGRDAPEAPAARTESADSERDADDPAEARFARVRATEAPDRPGGRPSAPIVARPAPEAAPQSRQPGNTVVQGAGIEALARQAQPQSQSQPVSQPQPSSEQGPRAAAATARAGSRATPTQTPVVRRSPADPSPYNGRPGSDFNATTNLPTRPVFGDR